MFAAALGVGTEGDEEVGEVVLASHLCHQQRRVEIIVFRIKVSACSDEEIDDVLRTTRDGLVQHS